MNFFDNRGRRDSSSEPQRDNWDNWDSCFLRTLGRGVGMMGGGEDDRSMNVSKNNYSIIINIYSINMQSYISYHYPHLLLGKKMHCPLSQLSRG